MTEINEPQETESKQPSMRELLDAHIEKHGLIIDVEHVLPEFKDELQPFTINNLINQYHKGGPTTITSFERFCEVFGIKLDVKLS